MSDERWLPVVGWEGLYEVSDHGRVRSVDRTLFRRNGWVFTARGVMLRPAPKRHGYVHVTLVCPGRKRRDPEIHLLVLEAFVGPRPAGMEGCHEDGVPTNNRVENLRWDTKKGNMADCARHGTLVHGERSHNARLTAADAREIRRRHAAGEPIAQIAPDFPQTVLTNLYMVVRGKTWKHA